LEKYKDHQYTIGSIIQDKEAFEFGTAIHNLLSSARWEMKELALGRDMTVGHPRTGVVVKVGSSEHQASG
jgi:hypothetical protein